MLTKTGTCFTKTDLFLIPLITRNALVVVPAMVVFDEIITTYAAAFQPTAELIDTAIDALQSLSHHLLGHKANLEMYLTRAQHYEIKAVTSDAIARIKEILLLIDRQTEYFALERLTVGMQEELHTSWKEMDDDWHGDAFHPISRSTVYH
jgi:hypothetical protein